MMGCHGLNFLCLQTSYAELNCSDKGLDGGKAVILVLRLLKLVYASSLYKSKDHQRNQLYAY